MSRALLERMNAMHVFDPMLLEVDMRDYHFPFDAMTGQRRTEGRLRDAVSRYERVALTGVPGSGKSSVARYSLEPPPERIAPIWVPVAYKDDAVATDPKRFAQYLVQVLADAAYAAQRLTRTQREEILRGATAEEALPAVARKHGLGLRVTAWILDGGIARDVTRTIGAGRFPRSEEAVLAKANDALDAIRAYDLDPVLVMDDTDRFVGRANADQMIPAFFADVLRSLVDHLHAGVVVAAHPFYLERTDYKTAVRGLIEHRIKIPAVPSAAALGKILTPRIKYARERATLEDAMAPAALRILYRLYKVPGAVTGHAGVVKMGEDRGAV